MNLFAFLELRKNIREQQNNLLSMTAPYRRVLNIPSFDHWLKTVSFAVKKLKDLQREQFNLQRDFERRGFWRNYVFCSAKHRERYVKKNAEINNQLTQLQAEIPKALHAVKVALLSQVEDVLPFVKGYLPSEADSRDITKQDITELLSVVEKINNRHWQKRAKTQLAKAFKTQDKTLFAQIKRDIQSRAFHVLGKNKTDDLVSVTLHSFGQEEELPVLAMVRRFERLIQLLPTGDPLRDYFKAFYILNRAHNHQEKGFFESDFLAMPKAARLLNKIEHGYYPPHLKPWQKLTKGFYREHWGGEITGRKITDADIEKAASFYERAAESGVDVANFYHVRSAGENMSAIQVRDKLFRAAWSSYDVKTTQGGFLPAMASLGKRFIACVSGQLGPWLTRISHKKEENRTAASSSANTTVSITQEDVEALRSRGDADDVQNELAINSVDTANAHFLFLVSAAYQGSKEAKNQLLDWPEKWKGFQKYAEKEGLEPKWFLADPYIAICQNMEKTLEEVIRKQQGLSPLEASSDMVRRAKSEQPQQSSAKKFWGKERGASEQQLRESKIKGKQRRTVPTP